MQRIVEPTPEVKKSTKESGYQSDDESKTENQVGLPPLPPADKNLNQNQDQILEPIKSTSKLQGDKIKQASEIKDSPKPQGKLQPDYSVDSKIHGDKVTLQEKTEEELQKQQQQQPLNYNIKQIQENKTFKEDLPSNVNMNDIESYNMPSGQNYNLNPYLNNQNQEVLEDIMLSGQIILNPQKEDSEPINVQEISLDSDVQVKMDDPHSTIVLKELVNPQPYIDPTCEVCQKEKKELEEKYEEKGYHIHQSLEEKTRPTISRHTHLCQKMDQ